MLCLDCCYLFKIIWDGSLINCARLLFFLGTQNIQLSHVWHCRFVLNTICQNYAAGSDCNLPPCGGSLLPQGPPYPSGSNGCLMSWATGKAHPGEGQNLINCRRVQIILHYASTFTLNLLNIIPQKRKKIRVINQRISAEKRQTLSLQTEAVSYGTEHTLQKMYPSRNTSAGKAHPYT